MSAAKTPRQAMPEQEPAIRARNFEEVPLGYTPEQAVAEASRCCSARTRRASRAVP